MRCDDCRDAISAKLDGELGPSESRRVEVHLGGCAACARFEERAAALTRAARLRVAETAPDLVDTVLGVADTMPMTGGGGVRSVLRMALGGAGVAQLGLAVLDVTETSAAHGGPQLIGVASAHLAHESAAWGFALGVGFLWVACGGRARGIVPIVAAFVGGLVVLSVADLVVGTVGINRPATHLVAAFGLVMLVALGRSAPGDGGGTGGARRDEHAQAPGGPAPSPVPGISDDPAA